MRLAGTAKQYSMSAMPQLARMTPASGTSLKRRWPYHAVVMKTLEQISIRIGKTYGEIGRFGMDSPVLCRAQILQRRRFVMVA